MKNIVKYQETIVTAICVLVMAAIVYVLFYEVVVKDIQRALAMQHTEGQCIARYISLQYERRDIEVGNGTCWIKKASE